jgi:FRG domain-containing protein
MSWREIVETAAQLEESWRAGGSLAWYRGHADATWELKSTLHREVKDFVKTLATPPNQAKQVKLLRGTYKTEYRSFRASAWPLLDQRERNDWGIVFAMQHYGQITRLLDWTESLACAAYFALTLPCEKCGVSKKNAAIWMVNPQELNKESQGLDGLIGLDDPEDIVLNDGTVFDVRAWHPKFRPPNDRLLKSIAISPDFTNPRMTAQRAAFTMSGDSFNSLDKEFPNLLANGFLRKFVLSPAAKKDATSLLRASGLDAYSFFPDLHGLALRHKDKVRERFELLRKVYGAQLKP